MARIIMQKKGIKLNCEIKIFYADGDEKLINM